MLNRFFLFSKEKKEKRILDNYKEESFLMHIKALYKDDKNFEKNLFQRDNKALGLKEVITSLLKNHFISEEDLFLHLSSFYSIPYENDKNFELKNSVILRMKKFENDFIYENKFIIISDEENLIKIATCYPDSIDVFERIKLHDIGLRLEKVCISFSTFNYLYNQYLDKLSLISDYSFNTLEANQNPEIDDLTNTDNPVVKLVDNILNEAIRKESSDIHIEIYRNEVKIKNRIDGVLVKENTSIPKNYHDMIISRIKILASLNIAEHRVPQDGRFKKIIRDKEVDFRVSIMPTVYGENVVLRILDKKGGILSLENLGFSKDERKSLLDDGRAPHGLILVTGPTGSGKTTTLYALLNEIGKKEEKIITIEDPIEYQLDDIVQIPVNEKKGLTFAKGLRSILRQDPDKIMVGEIRDAETAEIAVQAALTGHLVLTTLHSNSTVESIGRLINMGVDTYQFASALNLIVGQRLIRKICNSCEGVGCLDCNNTGYKGREGIYEILRLDDEIKEMMINKDSPIKIRDKAIEKGMVDIRKVALSKIKNKITTKEEYIRVIGKWEDLYDKEIF